MTREQAGQIVDAMRAITGNLDWVRYSIGDNYTVRCYKHDHNGSYEGQFVEIDETGIRSYSSDHAFFAKQWDSAMKFPTN